MTSWHVKKKKYTHETYSCVVTFCSSHAMASSVIYYSTEAQKNELYLFYIIIKLANIMPDQLPSVDVIRACVL